MDPPSSNVWPPRSQFPTFSGYDEAVGYGFVTCLVAFDVRRWLDSGVVAELEQFIHDQGDAHPETYIHDLAEKVHPPVDSQSHVGLAEAPPAACGFTFLLRSLALGHNREKLRTPARSRL